MFITALFIIARTWKQPRCPSADEWIRKSWYIYTMEYYSAIKKSTYESVLMRWMKLEPIIQSEVSQKEKHRYSMLLLLLSRFSHDWLYVTPWTAAYQASPSMGFSRQEHWSGLPFPSPGDLLHPGIEPGILTHIYGFRKKIMITLYVRQQKGHTCIEQSFGLCGRGRGQDDMREWHWNMWNIIYETNRQSRFDAQYRVLGAGALGWLRGLEWGGRWEGGSGWETHVHS